MTTKKAAAKTSSKKATKKAAKKAVTAAKPRAAKVSTDPDVIHLQTFQDKTKERMGAKAVLNIYRKIKKATKAKPIVHKSLNLYDKRLARELARLGLVNKADLPDIGLAYFPAN